MRRARHRSLDEVESRFWLYTHKMPGESACWVWVGAHSGSTRVGKMYGCLTVVGGHSMLAHRYSYERFVGPIPEGYVIDHLCGLSLCVRPDHLEPVTLGENTRRARQRERAQGKRPVDWARLEPLPPLEGWVQPSLFDDGPDAA